MSKHTFTPGDTVIHDATGERGTLTSTNGYSAVVEWDITDGKAPGGILPVTDLVAAIDELIEELSSRRNDIEAAAMTAWLAKPIGHHASKCERTHRMICAIQIVRTRQTAYSVGLLADEIGTPRSTLRDRLNGTGIITVTDICRISMTFGVPMPDLYALAEKGEIK